jgi:hypothetical protein
VENLPPTLRDFLPDDETLFPDGRKFLRRIATHVRRRRGHEVRPDGATAQTRDEDGRDRRRGASTETTNGL